MSRRYGTVVALDDLSLSFAAGTVTAVIGSSGSGKSTVLRLLLGLDWPDQGEVRVGGEPVTRRNRLAIRQRIGTVIQDGGLFPHLSARDNLALLPRHLGWSDARIDRRADELRALVQLPADALRRYPSELSGGQRQRVALARALVIEPPVLLLDEPLSNLDAKLREEMQFELRQIQRKVGTTTVMVTHDQSEAMSISDRVVVMEAGRATQIDHPHRVYEHPRTRFISTFVGKANLVPGKVTTASATHTHVGAGPIEVQVEGAQFRPGAAVLLSVRPEKLQLVPTVQGRIDGEVCERFFLGSQWLYRVGTAMGDLMVLAPNDGRSALDEGERTGLDWPDHCMRLLPADEAAMAEAEATP